MDDSQDTARRDAAVEDYARTDATQLEDAGRHQASEAESDGGLPRGVTGSAGAADASDGAIVSRLRAVATSLRAQLPLRVGQAALGIGVVILWELASRAGIGRALYVSRPSAIWTFLQGSWASGELIRHSSATLKATTVAFVIASVFGVIAGLSLALLPRLERLLHPYINALNSLPRIALAPLFILFFGIGMASKVALAVSLVFFILLINARAGVQSADQDIMRMATMFGTSKFQRFFKVLLPMALPSIFAGLRLGIIYSLLGVVTGEIIAARVGLGQLLMRYSGIFRIDAVYGLLFVLAIIATGMNVAMNWLETKLLSWAPPDE